MRLLGVHIDEVMDFEAHTGNVVRTCFFQLSHPKAIGNCIPLDTANTLVNAFVVTRLDYCIYVCMYVHLYCAVLITRRSSRMRYGRA